MPVAESSERLREKEPGMAGVCFKMNAVLIDPAEEKGIDAGFWSG